MKKTPRQLPRNNFPLSFSVTQKPPLLLHICCAPDLSRPLHRLKQHFKLYLFRYNPNIHPRKEHQQRYVQFLKLVGLEKGDYEILEDRYEPKEFFDAMIEQRETIHPKLKDAPRKQVLQVAGEMEEWSDRCNPCYAMRLEAAARIAAKEGIQYFTSTLLISPKKKMDKLYHRGKEAEVRYPATKFLRFDFAKNDGYHHAVNLTKKHGLRRQNYC
ncbi:MAG: epoxyqueuosine reductase QueH [bacterium]|nr:epoxyqueuosine reductase QueH [bacterium]